MDSQVLAALYDGDRDTALAAADGRELDIFEAAALGRCQRVLALVAADPALAQALSEDGFTPLHLAAFFAAGTDAALALLDGGADPNAAATNGSELRPINSAAAAGNRELVALLLDRG
ncbi:MAG: ankyrin repeat domain-containing protein, partial [Geminicoccaceae bacterium]